MAATKKLRMFQLACDVLSGWWFWGWFLYKHPDTSHQAWTVRVHCVKKPSEVSLKDGGKCGIECFYYRGANYLAQYKIDMDKFRTPTSYQIFPSILRMRCVKLCAPGMGCRRGFLRAACTVKAQETWCQLTLCSL